MNKQLYFDICNAIEKFRYEYNIPVGSRLDTKYSNAEKNLLDQAYEDLCDACEKIEAVYEFIEPRKF